MGYTVKVELTEKEVEEKQIIIAVDTKGQAKAIKNGLPNHNIKAISTKEVEL